MSPFADVLLWKIASDPYGGITSFCYFFTCVFFSFVRCCATSFLFLGLVQQQDFKKGFYFLFRPLLLSRSNEVRFCSLTGPVLLFFFLHFCSAFDPLLFSRVISSLGLAVLQVYEIFIIWVGDTPYKKRSCLFCDCLHLSRIKLFTAWARKA